MLEMFKVIFKGNVHMAHAKELFVWTLIFLDHKEFEYISENESLHGAKNKTVGSQHGENDLVDDSDVKGVSKTFFGDKHPSPNNSVCNSSKKENDHRGVDLNTKTDKVNSPLVHMKVMNNSHEVHKNVTSNGESTFNYSHNAHNGGLILEVLDDMIRIKDKKLQQSGAINSIKEKLIDIDKNLDSRNVSDEILLKRMELTRQLHDINQMEARDYVQKSKIKWAIEGDKNLKFFHVWNCVKNKSPSPDGYTFEFFRRYWRFIGSDFCSAVECFFESGPFPKGSNSSFISLIPKVTDAKFVTYFRPISMIGCVYRVVTKILANRLATVISDLVSDIQLAFVANRKNLDGPFILNELLAWCKRKKKQAMIFKVDFAKAYDSVDWDYLLDVLQAFGFGPNWCKATSDGLFEGIQIQGSMDISHLFYADDAVFIGLTLLKSVLDASPLYNMSINKVPKGVLKEMEAIRCSVTLSASKDRWICDLNGDGVFRVKEINVFAWHARLDRLPTRSNLVRRGVVLESSLCPLCGLVLEDIHHVLFRCDTSKLVFYRTCRWWDLYWHALVSFSNWNASFFAIRLPSRIKLILEGVFYVAWWHLWVYRNQSMFAATPPRRLVIFDDIVSRFFTCEMFQLKAMWVVIKSANPCDSSALKEIQFVLMIPQWPFSRVFIDTEVTNLPLRVKFPRLFDLETDKESMVASRLGSFSADASFRRSVRDGVERQQYDDLNSVSGSITLSASKDR
nr:RNA-directed DNA polymerase, eukaryota [Tanacetum cinerariifolium]